MHWDKPRWVPATHNDLVEWWASKKDVGPLTSDIKTSILFILWNLWTHINDGVFNDAAPMALTVLQKIKGEG